MWLLILLVSMLVPSLAAAQLAVEIMPGVTSYDYGRTHSVEIIPGHKQFSGEIEGTVTEIAPGIRHYNLHPNPLPPANSRAFEDLATGLEQDRAESAKRMDDFWQKLRRGER